MGSKNLESFVDIEDFLGNPNDARLTQIAVLGAVYGSDTVRGFALTYLEKKYGDSIVRVYREGTKIIALIKGKDDLEVRVYVCDALNN